MKVEILHQYGYDFLWIDGYLWMWTIPAEVKIQQDLAKQAHGDVLVAGYGLGLVQKFLTENPKVTSVLTIENIPEVAEACNALYSVIYGEIMFNDFFTFQSSIEFDCVIGDIWPEIDPEGLAMYKKFREKAVGLIKPGGLILGWGMDYFKFLLEKEKVIA